MPARNGNKTGQEGATLMEIIIAMVVIGLVSSGIVTAFVFSRRVTHRSGSELSAVGLAQQTTEALRGAVGGPITGSDLTLATPGIYVDQNMQNPPTDTAGNPAIRRTGLNFPAEFARYQTSALADPNQPAGISSAGVINAGDGRMYIVETNTDLDNDGFTGLNVDGSANGSIELRRVKVRIQWTTTNVQ